MSAARCNEQTNAFRNFPDYLRAAIDPFQQMSDVLLWYASLLPLLVMQAKRWLEIETLDGAIAAVRFAD